MCKRHAKIVHVAEAGEAYDVYEGQTTRLTGEKNTCGAWNWNGRSFPWWTLWFIWPIIALAKGFGTLIFGTVATSWEALGAIAVPANVLVAAALIIIGLALLRRR